MSVLILLIAVSLALSAGFVWICIVSIRSGQFDDLESPKWRVFFSNATETLPLSPGSRPGRRPGSKDETLSRIAPNDPH